ncbi:hypothetical protein HGRIS_012456 [Hohenbuehelia grisea]|uniref:UPF3 domain-containing protein n=1 Tax=Hohenbuehelia grisea TaxID=104357 RepID=A0ABR3ISF0_9AGAR
MSTTAPPKGTPAKSKREAKREREKEKAGQHQSTPNERLKTIVRRLPPNLPEEIFWQSVATWVSDETAVWRTYYQGKLRKKLNKENVSSRAYIAFKNEEHLLAFSRSYDGHIFRDKAGVESQAVVEFAPYQKIPPEKRKVDARLGTIEKDEDYISFVDSLNAAKESQEPVTLETLVAASQPPPLPTTTPLLEALKAKQSADRDREAIIRNHAHYKDPSVHPGASKKDGKKRDRDRDSRDAGSSQKQTQAAAASGSAVEALQAIGKKAAKRNAPQKQPSGAASSSKTNSNAPAAATPKTPPKGPKGRKAAAATAPPAQIEIIKNIKSNVAAASTAPSEIAQSTDAPSQASVSSRRGRPVIGLASRHFEAALSGAGVAVSPAERRARRERDKERIDLAAPADATPSEADAGAKDKAPVRAARSPKRDRRRKEGEGAGSAESASGSGSKAEVKVPSILQRIDLAAQAGEGSSSPVAGMLPRLDTAAPPDVNTGSFPARGGRRGRGRGRGAPPARGGG